MRDVQHRAVLNAGARADLNRMHIAADDSRRPHGRVVADRDLANDDRRLMNENARSERGRNALVSFNCHRCRHGVSSEAALAA